VRIDGRTDVTKVLVAFDNFANEPTKFCSYDIPFTIVLAFVLSYIDAASSCSIIHLNRILLTIPQIRFSQRL